MAIYENTYTINYIDIDENNRLTNRNFIKYLQEVGGEHSSSVGYGLNNLLKDNMAWIILNWKLKILKYPKCGDKIIIKTWISKFDRIFAYRDFEIFDTDNNLIAIATSKWVLKNHEKQSIIRLSSELIKAYDEVDKFVFEEKYEEKINIPENFDSSFEYVVQRRDIDTNHHVNNLYYIDFAYEALPDEIYSCNLSNIEVIYKKEIKYKEKIVCCYSNIGNEHVVVIKSEDLSKVHAIVKLF